MCVCVCVEELRKVITFAPFSKPKRKSRSRNLQGHGNDHVISGSKKPPPKRAYFQGGTNEHCTPHALPFVSQLNKTTTTMSTPPSPPASGTAGAAATSSMPGGATGTGAHVHAALPPHAGPAPPPPPPPKPNVFVRTWAHRGKITFGLFLAYSSANFF